MTTTSRLGSSCLGVGEELEAVGAGQDDVGDEHVEAALPQEAQGRLRVGGHLDLEAAPRAGSRSRPFARSARRRRGGPRRAIAGRYIMAGCRPPGGAQGADLLGRRRPAGAAPLAGARRSWPCSRRSGEVIGPRRGSSPTASVSTVLGLPAGRAPLRPGHRGARPRLALRVEALHGIVDLADAEVFQLPVHTPLPQPSPFAGALVVTGEVALELAVSALGFAPLEPARTSANPRPRSGLGRIARDALRARRRLLRRAALARWCRCVEGAAARRRCRSRRRRTAGCSTTAAPSTRSSTWPPSTAAPPAARRATVLLLDAGRHRRRRGGRPGVAAGWARARRRRGRLCGRRGTRSSERERAPRKCPRNLDIREKRGVTRMRPHIHRHGTGHAQEPAPRG